MEDSQEQVVALLREARADALLTQNLALLAGVMMARDQSLDTNAALTQASLLSTEAKAFLERTLRQIAQRRERPQR